MTPILQVNNITVAYGNELAVQDVSFSIAPGKIVGLLGPNGSGKTSIIKTIMGLLPFNGTVKLAAPDGTLVDPGVAANAHLAYLPDVGHIPGWFTIVQAVGFFADFYADFNRDKALDMIHAMDIPRRKPLRALSRGMQEKVQLALVMARQARLYVLDEPIGAVDPAARDFILNTILTHFAEDASILLASHIIADIEPVLDDAIILKAGKILLADEADALRDTHGQSLDALFREVFRHAG